MCNTRRVTTNYKKKIQIELSGYKEILNWNLNILWKVGRISSYKMQFKLYMYRYIQTMKTWDLTSINSNLSFPYSSYIHVCVHYSYFFSTITLVSSYRYVQISWIRTTPYCGTRNPKGPIFQSSLELRP